MKFVGHNTYEKLILKSGEDRTVINETIKQGITKKNISKISPASTFVLVVTHKRTLVISSQKSYLKKVAFY